MIIWYEGNLPWWDRLFGTYRAEPAAGHDAMVIGIEQFRDPGGCGSTGCCCSPSATTRGRYPLGQREGQA